MKKKKKGSHSLQLLAWRSEVESREGGSEGEHEKAQGEKGGINEKSEKEAVTLVPKKLHPCFTSAAEVGPVFDRFVAPNFHAENNLEGLHLFGTACRQREQCRKLRLGWMETYYRVQRRQTTKC